MRQLATGYGLIEGPVWDERRGLIFSDVIGGGVFRLTANGAVEPVFGHRRGIGGMALHEAGGLVVSGRNVALKLFDDETTRVLLETTVEPGVVGFNDLTTDTAGRIYVGSLAFRPVGADDAPKPGFLHLIDLDGSARTLWPGIQLTNGLGLSPDGRHLYHSDSLTRAIWVYDVAADGTVAGRRRFAELDEGIPDGLALGADGSVWVAAAHDGMVVGFAPDGSERARIAVPLPMVTSVCFGGPDLDTLYVVTGSDGADGDRAGGIFATDAPVAGLAVAPARVKAPKAGAK